MIKQLIMKQVKATCTRVYLVYPECFWLTCPPFDLNFTLMTGSVMVCDPK